MAKCAQLTTVVGSDSWAPSVYTSPNATTPVQVAQPNANRRGVLVVLTTGSAGTCHVRAKANASSSDSSYPLESNGEGVSINTTAEVWVVADSSAGATVKVIEEFGAPGAVS